MEQETLKSNLDELERKILVLLKERKTLIDELANVKSENKKLKADIKGREERIASLKNSLSVDRMSAHINETSNPQEKADLKKRLDEYIVEIDRCIAYLND